MEMGRTLVYGLMFGRHLDNISYLGPSGPLMLRVPLNAKVANASGSKGWTLASPRSEEFLHLHIHLTTFLPFSFESLSDCYEWNVDGVENHEFSSARTWEVMRTRVKVKSWYNLICFKGTIPKHSFTMWIINYNRLLTRSKLRRMTLKSVVFVLVLRKTENICF